MTALAARGARFHNGVSRIHGDVAAHMESYIWPQIPPQENPIGYVTNGVHVPTFLAQEWTHMLDMHFGGGWRNELLNEEFWERVDDIPDHTFWSIRQSLKTKLYKDIYQRVCDQLRRNGSSPTQIERMTRFLNTPEKDVLTVGFARRFATYKRATLLFSDPQRLARLLNDVDRPVLFISRARLIRATSRDRTWSRSSTTTAPAGVRRQDPDGGRLRSGAGRKLVTGVDVWLNNPLYPMEASGTSGEKAGINGVINLSVLDGWWVKATTARTAGRSPRTVRSSTKHFRNREEANELLDLLETK